MQKTVRLILGDQLHYEHSWFSEVTDAVVYVLMEVRQETDYTRHHIQKILSIFGAMRRFAAHLESAGHQVRYLKLSDSDNKQSIPDNLQGIFEAEQASHFEYLLPDEYRLDEQLHAFGESLSIGCEAVDTEHFLSSRDEPTTFFKGSKTWLMERFYRHMRKQYDVLMEGTEPAGAQWNFDADNRNRYDGKVSIPAPLMWNHNLQELKEMVDAAGVKYIGQVDAAQVNWPLTRQEALQQLDWFIQKALPYFGTYQDAMAREEWTLFHSRLSFALNVKMLSPLEVIKAAERAWQEQPDRYELNQTEGFIRQILGWREYMRGIYWARMPDYAALNYFEHEAKLPDWYWTGQTKMNCLAKSITQSLEHAYAHHIQRLMVTGNFALLAGIHPDEVDAWYLGIYIDAFEWVEMPNTRGMSQFADGGIVGSKPYVSSANYMHKMSDYCKSCHYDHKKKVGEGACPFNLLYWDFYARHRDKLAKNPRIGMAYRTWDRMGEEKQIQITEEAAQLRQRLDDL